MPDCPPHPPSRFGSEMAAHLTFRGEFPGEFPHDSAMTPTPLAEAELQDFLSRHPGWSLESGMLVRTFEARTFLDGIEFVHRVARVAEAVDHHPDIDIRWRKVTLRLITHDAGNRVTALDTRVAADCSALFESM